MILMGCNSKRSVSVETEGCPERRRSVKPEWLQEEARFIRNLSREQKSKKSSSVSPYPLPASPFCCDRNMGDRKGVEDKGLSVGFIGTPEIYIYRQKYLRSYKFTTEEEKNVRNKSNGVIEKCKRWVKQKGKGKGKGKGLHRKCQRVVKDKGNSMIICCRHCYFKFLVCFSAQVDVEEGVQGPAAASSSSSSSFKSGPRR